MRAILYIGHGSRSEKGANEAKSFIQRVINQIQISIQEIGFLELTEPFIEEAFERCVNRGATEITVIPLFLLAAGHIKEDIPRILSTMQSRYPEIQVDVKDPFGVQGKLLNGLAELISESAPDLSPEDSILIVGRGSSDPSIHYAFKEIALGIKRRLKVDRVSVCYLAAAEPRLKEGLQTILQEASGRVIVVPYLLFSGLLLAEITQLVAKMQKLGYNIMHSGPLSTHKVMEDIIVDRVNQID